MLKIKDQNGNLVATLSDEQDEPVLQEDAKRKRKARKKMGKAASELGPAKQPPVYYTNSVEEDQE